VRAVIAQSFSRIHKANLINVGILPLEFIHQEDLARFSSGDRLRIRNLTKSLRQGGELPLENVTKGYLVETRLDLTPRLKEILLSGGLLSYTRERHKLDSRED